MQVVPVIIALLVGFVTGFLVSVPIGPINITIINEGARRGFHWALFIGLGAVSMDLIYCIISFAGFSSMLDSKMMRATMELLSFVLMVVLGIKYLKLQTIPMSKSAEVVEEKLHPHSAFMTGFVRVLGNPGVLLMWVAITASFVSHDFFRYELPFDFSGRELKYIDLYSKIACTIGVGVGATTWFYFLSYIISRSHRKFSSQTLVRMSHVSGIFLLILAAIISIRIIRLLAEAHRGGWHH